MPASVRFGTDGILMRDAYVCESSAASTRAFFAGMMRGHYMSKNDTCAQQTRLALQTRSSMHWLSSSRAEADTESKKGLRCLIHMSCFIVNYAAKC